MTRIIDHTGQSAERTVTVADIAGLHGTGDQFAQVTAGTPEESAAADAAGIEMVVCMSQSVPAVREGSSRVFVTAAIDFEGDVSVDELLGRALKSLVEGADAIITARRLEVVERLASEDIPVMGHLGFVPKKSNLLGGVRAVGKTADEAIGLWGKFRDLENAGAFAVECELIPSNVMAEIHQRTAMTTISLGSGPSADVLFLFTSDLTGDGDHIPRHARVYADFNSIRSEMDAERRRALAGFRADVKSGSFPDDSEVVMADPGEVERFTAAIDG